MFPVQYSQIIFVALIAAVPVLGEEIDANRPAAIKTKNVPPIPTTILDELAKYKHVRAAGFADWAPDGRGILIRTRFANSVQLHRVYEPVDAGNKSRSSRSRSEDGFFRVTRTVRCWSRPAVVAMRTIRSIGLTAGGLARAD
jgi:hypothetical protein